MGIDVIPLFLTLAFAGAIAGITAGLFGNGGGFVVVPALVAVFSMFDQQDSQLMYVAVGTSLASIVISSARSVQAHRARGAVDFQVLKAWSIWLFVGVLLGLYIASLVDGQRLFAVFATGVLLYSIYFLFPKQFGQIGRTFEMPKGWMKASPRVLSWRLLRTAGHWRRHDHRDDHDHVSTADSSGGGHGCWCRLHHRFARRNWFHADGRRTHGLAHRVRGLRQRARADRDLRRLCAHRTFGRSLGASAKRLSSQATFRRVPRRRLTHHVLQSATDRTVRLNREA